MNQNPFANLPGGGGNSGGTPTQGTPSYGNKEIENSLNLPPDPFAHLPVGKTPDQELEETKKLVNLHNQSTADQSIVARINRETGNFAPGLVQGINKFVQDAAQTSYLLNKTLVPTGYNKRGYAGMMNYINDQRNKYESQYANTGKPMGAQIGEFTGEQVVPALATMGVGQGAAATQGIKGILQRALINGATSAGLSHITAPEGQKLEGAAIGGIGGAALSAGLEIAPKILSNVGKAVGFKPAIQKDILSQVENSPSSEKILKSARDLGFPLTPAEVSRRSQLLSQQAKLGVTPGVQKQIDKYFDERSLLTAQTVNNFKQKIYPTTINENIAKDVRDWAANRIEQEVQTQKNFATPLYKKAYQVIVPSNVKQELLNNKIIMAEYGRLSKDPAFQELTKGLPQNSLGQWDTVKKFLDRKYQLAVRSQDPALPGPIKESLDLLKSKLDSISPEYPYARKLFEEGITKQRAYDETILGNVGKMDNTELDSFIPKLFNPKSTGVNSFRVLRDELTAERPELWYGMVRKNIEDRLGQARNLSPIPGEEGIGFYKNILGTGADRQRILESLKYNKPAQKALIDISRVFSALSKKSTTTNPKAAAFGLNMKNMGITTLINDFFGEMVRGGYNRQVSRIIFNPHWQDALDSMAKSPFSNHTLGTLRNVLSRSAGPMTNIFVTGAHD
jgi:hypothetical protein